MFHVGSKQLRCWALIVFSGSTGPRGRTIEIPKGSACAVVVAKHFEEARAEIYGPYEKGQVCAHKDKDQALSLVE